MIRSDVRAESPQALAFRRRYSDLLRRHLDRDPKDSDGVTIAAVTKCENRLGLCLPVAMREYYLIAGRLDRLNRAHNIPFSLSELRIEESHLWFMEENQVVVYWGLPLKRVSSSDPIVHQRARAEGANWYSEKSRFSTFLIRMYDWQAGFADAPD